MTAHSDHVEAVLQARLDTKRVEHALIGVSNKCESLLHSVIQAVGDGSVISVAGDKDQALVAVRRLSRDAESMLTMIDVLDAALERYLGSL